jgi:large subunit ribosomal protein L17
MSSHMIRGRQLSRDTEHRIAMRRNLVQSLFEHGKVRTTYPKAKEVRAMAEKLITLARTGTLTARRRAIAKLGDRRLTDADQEFTGQSVIQKLFSEIGPSFKDRNGGYTRIIKLADFRIGDGGDLVLLQLLTEKAEPTSRARRSAGLRRQRSERLHRFAASRAKGDAGKGDAGKGDAGKGDAGRGESAKSEPAADAAPAAE